jgi:hypothetical protein
MPLISISTGITSEAVLQSREKFAVHIRRNGLLLVGFARVSGLDVHLGAKFVSRFAAQ